MRKAGANGAGMREAAVAAVAAELEDAGGKAAGAGAAAAAPALSPLSETLWRDRVGLALLDGDVSARLAWRDLTVTVALGSSGDTQAVLQGLTGHAEPGTITALMGPSGSGKSTLLDALAGRLAANAFLSGTVLLNGRKANLSFGAAAYVTQDDTLIGTLTVRETISYSARLRLPDNMPREEKQALVEGTIVEMGLQDCADTVIGNWHLRGISGGEKRRVSIALEILMRPRLLFLDEPTSGLDSASAFFVTQTLRGLARDGRTVIASVHQPSSEVFELFDSLYLLSGGKTVYFGKASEACEFFAQAGFPCPPLRNPSDHFLRCVNSDFDKVKATLKGSMKTKFERTDDPLERITTSEAMRRLISYYQHSQYYINAQQKVDEMARVKGTVLNAGGSQASFAMQTYTLTKRSFSNMSRDFGYYWLRLIIYIVVTICIGTIYLNVGTGYSSILARGACASFIFGFVTFMSIGGFPSFVEDMKVFQRERLNGHYGVLPFVISNTLSAMPFLILITFASGTLCYFMVRLHPGFMHYLFFVLCLYASVTVVESLMMAIASMIPNFLMGIIIGAGIQGIFMLVSGFFRLPHDIPKPFWRYPMSYISFHYWALQGQYQNDLKGLMFNNQDDELPKIPGDYILENVFQINVNRSKWLDLSVLFSMIIIYRLLFFIMIKISEDVTPWVRGYIARRRVQNRRQRRAELAAVRSPSLRGYVVAPTPQNTNASSPFHCHRSALARTRPPITQKASSMATIATMAMLKPAKIVARSAPSSSGSSSSSKVPSISLRSLHKSAAKKAAVASSSSPAAAAMAGAFFSALASSDAALAAQQIADVAAAAAPADDNRGKLLLVVVAPAIGWVLYNILQPALNQLNRMRSQAVIAGVGLGAAAAAGLACAPEASAAAQQIADLAAEAPADDNRGLLLLIVVAPAIGWVLFNILQPALNQLNRMRSD